MHIHFDMMGGLAGDMFLAAAIDADLVDLEQLTSGLRTLGLGTEIQISHEKVWRGAMSATHVKFSDWDPDADSDHRYLKTILEMIASSSFSQSVKDRASALFRTLGAAEAKVHGISIEEVHFHEVGAVDSILDFVSAAFILDGLDATFSMGEVPMGRGTIETAHGEIPLPAPATADLLRGFPMSQKQVDAELVTPTGAAILRSVNPSTERVDGKLQGIGYGAGTREIEGLSNVCRLLVFETAEPVGDLKRDVVTQLSCDLDDMTPEHLAFVSERLIGDGALDVVRIPTTMKKGRTGVRLEVLVPQADTEKFAKRLLRETSTFGVRKTEFQRFVLERSIREVETKFGVVRIKDGVLDGETVKSVPEYDDCRKLAEDHKVPISTVWMEAQQCA